MMKVEKNKSLGIEFFKKINNIRESPVSYSCELEKFKDYFKGNDFYLTKRCVLPTNEGIKALDDLINHYSIKKPIHLLKMEKSLNLICEDFCSKAKDMDDMNELNNTYNFEKELKKYGKINSGRYMNIIFNLLTEDSSLNSFLFLSCDGDETREYRDLLTTDKRVSKIGIHVTHFKNESSPVALVVLVDDFTPKPEYENDSNLNNLLGNSNGKGNNNNTNSENNNSKSVSFSENKYSNNNNLGKGKEEDIDPDLFLEEGVEKIEKSSRVVKEGLIEYVITKTVTYMADGEIKTQISKAKK